MFAVQNSADARAEASGGTAHYRFRVEVGGSLYSIVSGTTLESRRIEQVIKGLNQNHLSKNVFAQRILRERRTSNKPMFELIPASAVPGMPEVEDQEDALVVQLTLPPFLGLFVREEQAVFWALMGLSNPVTSSAKDPRSRKERKYSGYLNAYAHDIKIHGTKFWAPNDLFTLRDKFIAPKGLDAVDFLHVCRCTLLSPNQTISFTPGLTIMDEGFYETLVGQLNDFMMNCGFASDIFRLQIMAQRAERGDIIIDNETWTQLVQNRDAWMKIEPVTEGFGEILQISRFGSVSKIQDKYRVASVKVQTRPMGLDQRFWLILLDSSVLPNVRLLSGREYNVLLQSERHHQRRLVLKTHTAVHANGLLRLSLLGPDQRPWSESAFLTGSLKISGWPTERHAPLPWDEQVWSLTQA